MTGFVTQSGSIYQVDEANKTIQKAGNHSPVMRYRGTPYIMVGDRAMFDLEDGRTLVTNIVREYISLETVLSHAPVTKRAGSKKKSRSL